MKVKFYYIIAALMVLLIAGCQPKNYITSDKIEQRLLFQQYHIKYDAEKELLSTAISFTENNPAGRSVKLVKPSKISLNNIPLEDLRREDHSFGYFYENVEELPLTLSFNYSNGSDHSFMNEVVLHSIESEVPKITISKLNGATISYKGCDFSENELLYCSIAKETENDPEMISLESPENGKVKIYPDDIEDIEVGEYTLRLHRFFHSTEINGSERGGIIEGEYIAKSIKLTIIE